MALNQALGITPPPTRQAALPVPDAGAGYETQATAKRKELEPLQQRISEAQTEATKLAGEKATFETQQKAKQASGESQAMQSFEQRVAAAPMRPMLEQKTAQEKDFFFRPSQEDGLMMAGLASLITVLGTAVGKGGKGYAQAALSGMNGMMQGYRQGRDDVFRQEKMAFETNARALRDQISSIRQALQDYEKEAARDRDGALLRMREKLAQEGADFAAARVERQGVVSMLPELIRQERALNDQIGRYEMKATDARTRADAAEAARVAREEAATRQQQFQREMQEKAAQDREALARLVASLRPSSSAQLKPGALTTQAYVSSNVLSQDIASVMEKLKNPELVKQIKQYRVEAFLTEEGKILNQVLDSQIPTELRQFLTQIRDVRNNYYLNISGKAVTGGEALRSYGTVPQPGDSPEAIRDKFAGMKDRVDRSIKISQNLYGLPDLSTTNLAGTNTSSMLSPGQNYPLGAQESQVEGRRSFNSVQEAEAAKLPAGTKILINGRPATVE